MAADAGVAPGPAERARNAFPIQLDRDGLRALAGGKSTEDAPDDRGFVGDDFAVAADRLAIRILLLHDAIAVAEATAGLALLHPPAQAAMGLQSKVLQQEGVHRALETDVKLTDLALGEGDDGDIREAQVLEQRGDIRLIAGDPVQRLGQHDIKHTALRILQQRLNTRSEDHAGARDGGIVIGARDLPLLTSGVLAAEAELVLDRAFALVVGRIASIERDATHGWSPFGLILASPILLHGLGPIVVWGAERRELLAGDPPSDQSGDRQNHPIHLLPCLPVRLISALTVVGRYEADGLFSIIRHAASRFPVEVKRA